MMVGADRVLALSRACRFLVVVGILAAVLVVSPGAQSDNSASLTLYVYFGYNNDISVKLADGTPIGTAGGTPTVIPAGNYTVVLE
jgi:hypothetical protein